MGYIKHLLHECYMHYKCWINLKCQPIMYQFGIHFIHIYCELYFPSFKKKEVHIDLILNKCNKNVIKCKKNNWMLYQYNSLHSFQYDSYWPTLGGQYGNHIEMSANCNIDYNI